MTNGTLPRMPEINQVVLAGRLTRDPEFRVTQSGKAMCRFDLACNRRYQNKATGEWVEETLFVPVVAWAQTAETCSEKLRKGSPAKVEGRLRSREFEDKTGAKRKVLEINAFKVELLEIAKPSAPSSAPGQTEAVGEATPAKGKEGSAAGDEDLEEVPF